MEGGPDELDHSGERMRYFLDDAERADLLVGEGLVDVVDRRAGETGRPEGAHPLVGIACQEGVIQEVLQNLAMDDSRRVCRESRVFAPLRMPNARAERRELPVVRCRESERSIASGEYLIGHDARVGVPVPPAA